MSDDDSEKTEEPTQKKLDDSKKKGQVAFSREVSNFFMIFAFALALVMVFPENMRNALTDLGKYISNAHNIPVTKKSFGPIAEGMVRDSFAIILMPFLLLVVAGITAALIQNGFHISAESIKPKLEKISLPKGVKRLFSSRSLMEFIKGLLKIIVVGLIAYFSVNSELDQIMHVAELNGMELLIFINSLAMKILVGAIVAVFLIAVADFVYQKSQHVKQLRMSKQEIKDEYKQQEGDPQVKAKLRQLRMERAQQRMMAAVPTANVVITNPTHFAIALKYDQDNMDAPIVVAMGQDNIALKMKEVAEEHKVPQVRNAPLARALYADAEIDQEIPLDHYQAVAEVISYVYRTKNK